MMNINAINARLSDEEAKEVTELWEAGGGAKLTPFLPWEGMSAADLPPEGAVVITAPLGACGKGYPTPLTGANRRRKQLFSWKW